MKKHIKNKKAVGGIIVGAAVLSVGSVGFASWVIAGGDANQQANNLIGVQAATVEDTRLKIGDVTFNDNDIVKAANNTDSDKTFVNDDKTMAYLVFGPRHNDTTGPIQVSANNKTDIEHLSIKFEFTLESSALVNQLDKIVITPTYPDVLTTLQTQNLIANPSAGAVTLHDSANENHYAGAEWSYSTYSSTANTYGFDIHISTISNNVATVTITAKWGWGTAFNKVSPGNSANEAAGSIDAVVANLESLSSEIEAASNPSVSFAISATAKATA